MAKNIQLDKFNKISLKIDIDKIAKENAQGCAKRINDNIAREGWTGDYANSWIVSERSKPDIKSYWVHSTEYRLTHLLENGHLIVNKKNGVGWSPPFPHIRPAYDDFRQHYEKEARKVDLDLEIK